MTIAKSKNEELQGKLNTVKNSGNNPVSSDDDATKAAMGIVITTLSPPAAKLFSAVYEHARKIHLVKRQCGGVEGSRRVADAP